MTTGTIFLITDKNTIVGRNIQLFDRRKETRRLGCMRRWLSTDFIIQSYIKFYVVEEFHNAVEYEQFIHIKYLVSTERR